MKIVALDLGKFKTVACIYVEGMAEFITVNTCRQEFSELIKQDAADVVIFETCTAAGWLSSTQAMPSGRVFPFPFGMFLRRLG